jgi:hypothetical protein
MLFYTILPVQCASVSCLALKTDFSLDFSAEALFVYETAFLADLSQCKKLACGLLRKFLGRQERTPVFSYARQMFLRWKMISNTIHFAVKNT